MQAVTAIGGHSKRTCEKQIVMYLRQDKNGLPLWTGRIRGGAKPGMIATSKCEGISFGVEMAGAKRQQGSSLKVALPKCRLYGQYRNRLKSSMNSIDTRISIGGMASSIGERAKSGSHHEKLPARDIPVKSGPDNPVQTDISFSTYGSHNEHIAVVIKNQDTGEVIREIPSEEMQKLHAHLDMLI